jgi:general secretion pathway protein N
MRKRASLIGAVAFFLMPLSARTTSAQEGLDLYSATRERPLFSPARRPPARAVAAPADVNAAPIAAPPPQLVLSGVLLKSAEGIALLRKPNEFKANPYRLGQSIDGWLLAAIESRRVLISRDGRELWIEMAGPKR